MNLVQKVNLEDKMTFGILITARLKSKRLKKNN